MNRVLSRATGFTMEPVAGLVSPRAFMSRLRQGVFLATQYVPPPTAPRSYSPSPTSSTRSSTPRPLLADPEFAALNRLFGEATDRSPDDRIDALIRLYWYALEFGVVGQRRGPSRRPGAGLLVLRRAGAL